MSKPGILQCELYNMNIGHRSGIRLKVFSLCYEGRVVRIPDLHSYRLYPKGKEPQSINTEKEYKQSLVHRGHAIFFKEPSQPEINKGHGDKFYTAFDEAFGILYIDLKIMGMAARGGTNS